MHKRDPETANPRQPPSREQLIEKQIRGAQEAGAFDDLPFQGERIPLEDDSGAGDRALAYRMLRNARFAPPWIETDKQVRDLLAQRDAIRQRASGSSTLSHRRDRSELQRVVEMANRAIMRLNSEAPTERQHRRLLDADRELEALATAYAARRSSRA